MRNIDRIVFLCRAATFVFWMGIEVGIDEAKAKLATQCLPQPGTKLTSTIQGRAGVVCNYGGGYAKAATKREAT